MRNLGFSVLFLFLLVIGFALFRVTREGAPATQPTSGDAEITTGESMGRSSHPDTASPVDASVRTIPARDPGEEVAARSLEIEEGEAESEPSLPSRMQDIADTFLSDDPDTIGLRSLMNELGREAEVDPESVRKSGARVTGTLRFGEGLTAQFEYENGEYAIDFECPPEDRSFFFARNVSLFMTEKEGQVVGASTTVQSHPNTRNAPPSEMEDTCVGWTLSSDANGSKAGAIMVGNHEGKWRIGGIPHDSLDKSAEWGLVDYASWQDALQRYCR